MPSSKGRRHGKDLPQKKAAASRVHTTRASTKSYKQTRIEEDQYDTLAALSSRKSKANPKKLTLPSESTTSPEKQAPPPVNLPKSEIGIVVPQVVTLKKKKQGSSSEELSNNSNSTGDASSGNSTVDENASTGNFTAKKTRQTVILQEARQPP